MPAMPAMPSIPSIPGLRKGAGADGAEGAEGAVAGEGGAAASGAVSGGEDDDKSRYIRYGCQLDNDGIIYEAAVQYKPMPKQKKKIWKKMRSVFVLQFPVASLVNLRLSHTKFFTILFNFFGYLLFEVSGETFSFLNWKEYEQSLKFSLVLFTISLPNRKLMPFHTIYFNTNPNTHEFLLKYIITIYDLPTPHQRKLVFLHLFSWDIVPHSHLTNIFIYLFICYTRIFLCWFKFHFFTY